VLLNVYVDFLYLHYATTLTKASL